MDFSIALIILILKVGIKKLDGAYDSQAFVDDIFDAFGKESGKKLMGLISKSQSKMDHYLRDSSLKELGIPDDRRDKVREDVKAILKHVKISSDMLNNHDCNADAIVERIINEYPGNVGIKDDDTTIGYVRRVLCLIVHEYIQLVRNDGDFINGIIIDIRRILKEHSSALKSINTTVNLNHDLSEDIIRNLEINSKKTEENNKMLKAIFLAQQKSLKKEQGDWMQSEEEIVAGVDQELISTLIGLTGKGEEKNGRL